MAFARHKITADDVNRVLQQDLDKPLVIASTSSGSGNGLSKQLLYDRRKLNFIILHETIKQGITMDPVRAAEWYSSL